jgi:hypothetical protein
MNLLGFIRDIGSQLPAKVKKNKAKRPSVSQGKMGFL